MVVLFTGMSGIEISHSLSKYINEHKYFRSKHFEERKPILLKLEDEMKEVYYKNNPQVQKAEIVWVNTILFQSYSVLEALWQEAFENILVKVNAIYEEDREKCIFINLHACYLHTRTKEYISIVKIDKLKLLNPKMIITLIDDVYDIHHRLTKLGGIYHSVQASKFEMIHRYFNLLDWRSRETLMSRFLANHLNCKNYVFAVKHPFDTLTNLIFEDYPTVYLSHPITEVRRLEKKTDQADANSIKSEINQISDILSSNFTGFLPTTIDEYRIKGDTNIVKDGDGFLEEQRVFYSVLTKRWEEDKYLISGEMLYQPSGFKNINELWKKTKPEDTDISINELLPILVDTISDQVSTRDYTLVEQSDLLIIFRPFFNGNSSRGVLEEFNYFKKLQTDLEKKVLCFIYCPKQDLSMYYRNLFNKKILYYLNKSHELKTVGETPFNGITEKECEKLSTSASNKSLIFDLLNEVFDFHQINVSIANHVTPLSKNHVTRFKNTIVDTLFEDYTVVNDYLTVSTLFEKELMTPLEFCSKIN